MLFLAFLATLATPALAQTDVQRAEARAAATAAVRAFDEGRYDAVVDLCTRAETFMHAPTHVLLLARAQAKLGRLVEAQEAYFRIQGEDLPGDAPGPFVRAKEAASRELALLQPRVPKLRIAIEGADAKDVVLSIDGTPASSAFVGFPMPIDPGKHTIVATTAVAHSQPATVDIVEGATQSVALRLEPTVAPAPAPGAAPPLARPETPPATAPPQSTAPSDSVQPPRSSGLSTVAWVGLGVGGVGLAAAAVFVVLNNIERTNANNDCPGGSCPESKRPEITSFDNQANTDAALSWVSLGIGVAGAGLGTTLLLAHAQGGGSGVPTHAPGAGVAPRLYRVYPWSTGPQSAGLGVSGAF